VVDNWAVWADERGFRPSYD